MTGPLLNFDEARIAIEKATSLADLKEIRDQAAAYRHYIKAAGMSKSLADQFAEVRLRAERRAGEIIRDDTRIHKGRQMYHGDTFTLADLEVSRLQSSRWQKIAAVPDDIFEGYLAAAKLDQREITAVGLLQYWGRHRNPDDVDEPIPPRDGTYRAIVIDPPWPMRKIERLERPDQGVTLEYPILTLEEIADEGIVPVRAHADDDCHIYLWVTHHFLPAGLELLEAWGFRYQCVMTWRKNVGITPFSWMYDTEHVLFGTRGNLPLLQNGLRLSFEAPVQGHSIKPDVFYERVTAASPEPRIDMFARRDRPGFDTWGNEVTDAV